MYEAEGDVPVRLNVEKVCISFIAPRDYEEGLLG